MLVFLVSLGVVIALIYAVIYLRPRKYRPMKDWKTYYKLQDQLRYFQKIQ